MDLGCYYPNKYFLSGHGNVADRLIQAMTTFAFQACIIPEEGGL